MIAQNIEENEEKNLKMHDIITDISNVSETLLYLNHIQGYLYCK